MILILAVTALCTGVASVLIAVFALRPSIRKLRDEADTRLQLLASRIRTLEHQAARATLPDPVEVALPSTDPPPPSILRAEPASVEDITQQAGRALVSADAFRRFTSLFGGNGMKLQPGADAFDVISSPDALIEADLWAVSHQGEWLLYPGYNLRRSQSALLADSGRLARERLGWLFKLEAGDALAAYQPAVWSAENRLVRRGTLTLPF